MKKFFAIAAVMLATTVTMFAQDSVGSLSFYPKVGINISTLTKYDGDSRISLAFGAEGKYQITDMVAFTGGLIYSMEGAKDGNTTVKLDNLNIPLLANVYVAEGFAVKLGLQPAINVYSKSKTKGNDVTVIADMDAKAISFSIPVGLSYEFDNFIIDGRYNWGISKVINHSKCHNSVFQFSVGYKFNL